MLAVVRKDCVADAVCVHYCENATKDFVAMLRIDDCYCADNDECQNHWNDHQRDDDRLVWRLWMNGGNLDCFRIGQFRSFFAFVKNDVMTMVDCTAFDGLRFWWTERINEILVSSSACQNK